ncbi:serine/arginine repetitive matrix protein 2-like [Artemia franciscana]|uniref:serine/arginine repetitive matrix protein 2-like n=1 Tax=Artemia franciscana TaxID=6661 RepID=UPI0032DB0574
MNETDSELDGEWDLLPTSALVNNRKGIVAPRLMRLSSREDISLGEELYDSRLDDLILHSNGFLYPIFSRLQKDQHIACNICNTFVVGGVPVYSHMKGRKHAKALLGGPNVECNLKARLDVEYEFPKVKSIKEIPSTSSEYRGRESGFIREKRKPTMNSPSFSRSGRPSSRSISHSLCSRSRNSDRQSSPSPEKCHGKKSSKGQSPDYVSPKRFHSRSRSFSPLSDKFLIKRTSKSQRYSAVESSERSRSRSRCRLSSPSIRKLGSSRWEKYCINKKSSMISSNRSFSKNRTSSEFSGDFSKRQRSSNVRISSRISSRFLRSISPDHHPSSSLDKFRKLSSRRKKSRSNRRSSSVSSNYSSSTSYCSSFSPEKVRARSPSKRRSYFSNERSRQISPLSKNHDRFSSYVRDRSCKKSSRQERSPSRSSSRNMSKRHRSRSWRSSHSSEKTRMKPPSTRSRSSSIKGSRRISPTFSLSRTSDHHSLPSPGKYRGRKSSKWRKSHSKKRSNRPSQKRSSSESTNILFVARYLSILDDQLGSLAPLIRSILKKAKKAESAVKGGSNDLLSDDSVMNVLDLTKEKLIGNLTSGVLEKRNRKLTKRGIDYILALYKLHSQMLWLTMSAEVVENRPSTSSQLPTHPDFSMEVNAPDLSNQAPARNH